MIKLMNNFGEFKEVTGFILPGAVRLHSCLGEKYIDGNALLKVSCLFLGTLSVTLKRDNIGVPYMTILTFLPAQLNEPQFFKFV
jgi:hypothetical protein